MEYRDLIDSMRDFAERQGGTGGWVEYARPVPGMGGRIGDAGRLQLVGGNGWAQVRRPDGTTFGARVEGLDIIQACGETEFLPLGSFCTKHDGAHAGVR